MTRRLVEFIGVAAVLAAMIGLLNLAVAPGAAPLALGGVEVAAAGAEAQGQSAPADSERGPRTAWGEPDLQGIWNDPYQIPLQRPAQFADVAEFTAEQRAALDQERGALRRRDERAPIGSERDVRGAYNAVFESIRPTGDRTSLIVDPPNGRVPPHTGEAAERVRIDREFRLALLQSTETCRLEEPACAGWAYAPPSPLREEMPPFYNTGRLNRNDGPEDRSLSERCMAAGLPDFSGFRRIVQSPGSVAIFYDVGQGQGWQRNIPVDGSEHLPAEIRQRFGDSRGHWEGETLVVDVTNFSEKRDYRGSRENLHPDRALAAAGRDHARVHRDGRRSDDLDAAVDRAAGAGAAGRAVEPDLLRAAVPRGELRPAGTARGEPHRGAGVRRRARSRSGHAGHGDRRWHHPGPAGTVAGATPGRPRRQRTVIVTSCSVASRLSLALALST